MAYYGYTDLHCYESMGPIPSHFVGPMPMELNESAYDTTSVIAMAGEEDVGFSDFYAGVPKRKKAEAETSIDVTPVRQQAKKKKKKGNDKPRPYQDPVGSIPALEVDDRVVIHPATAASFSLNGWQLHTDPSLALNPLAARFDYLHRLCLGRYGPHGIVYNRIFDATLLFMPERVTIDTLNITAFTGSADGNAKERIVGTTKCMNSRRPFFICMQCFESTYGKPYIHNTYSGIITHFNTDHNGLNPGFVNSKKIYD